MASFSQSLGNCGGAALSGAILGFTGVAAGAFGAHALAGHLDPSATATFETAVRYQLIHALALLSHAALFRGEKGPAVSWSWRLFVAGTIIFSGSLYTLLWSGLSWLGAVTPIGGLALLCGWLLTGLAATTHLGRDG